MNLGVDLVLAGAAAIMLVFLATIQSAYEQMSDVSLHVLRGEARSDRRAAFVAELMERRGRFELSLLLGIYPLVVGLSVLAVRVAGRLVVPRPAVAAFGAALAVVVVCRLVVPRLIAQNAPERVLRGLLPLFKLYYRLAAPAVVPLDALLAVFRRDVEAEHAGEEDSFEETMTDLQALIDVGAEEGIIEESEGLMIQSIVELGDTNVREVMTPRPQIVAIPATATAVEARDLIVASKHSRLPVYSEQVDNVEGVLYVRDLLAVWSEGRESEPITEVMRPAYFVPDMKPVADLLEEMRKSKMQIAVVIDEYGAVAGLVTIEDLLEEIVGEIEDEDDEPVEDDVLVAAEDGSMLVKGSTEIRKIELHLHRELEEDDFTTVAGLIITELGHLPAPGERLEFKGVEFEVLEADDRRVNLVRLRPLVNPESGAEQEAAQQG